MNFVAFKMSPLYKAILRCVVLEVIHHQFMCVCCLLHSQEGYQGEEYQGEQQYGPEGGYREVSYAISRACISIEQYNRGAAINLLSTLDLYTRQ